MCNVHQCIPNRNKSPQNWVKFTADDSDLQNSNGLNWSVLQYKSNYCGCDIEVVIDWWPFAVWRGHRLQK